MVVTKKGNVIDHYQEPTPSLSVAVIVQIMPLESLADLVQLQILVGTLLIDPKCVCGGVII